MTNGAAGRWVALLAGLASAWLLLACAPALAHATLVGASPPRGGSVSEPPRAGRAAVHRARGRRVRPGGGARRKRRPGRRPGRPRGPERREGRAGRPRGAARGLVHRGVAGAPHKKGRKKKGGGVPPGGGG